MFPIDGALSCLQKNESHVISHLAIQWAENITDARQMIVLADAWTTAIILATSHQQCHLMLKICYRFNF